MDNKLFVIGTHVCQANDDLYRIVDFLNRNLKDKQLVFGLARAEENDKMVLTVYRS